MKNNEPPINIQLWLQNKESEEEEGKKDKK